MMCYIHFFSASRRLAESEKTVKMLSSSKHTEKDVPEMVLAQRDFIKKEVEYFAEECVKWNYYICIGFCFLFLFYAVGRITNNV